MKSKVIRSKYEVRLLSDKFFTCSDFSYMNLKGDRGIITTSALIIFKNVAGMINGKKFIIPLNNIEFITPLMKGGN